MLKTNPVIKSEYNIAMKFFRLYDGLLVLTEQVDSNSFIVTEGGNNSKNVWYEIK